MMTTTTGRQSNDTLHNRVTFLLAVRYGVGLCGSGENGVEEFAVIYRRGWVPVLWRHDVEKKLKEEGFDNWQEISKFLCDGSSKAWIDSDLHPEQYAFQIVDNTQWMNERDAKLWQRVNRLWFVPLYLLTIPFQWLIRGRVGFETTSRIGMFCQKITGLK